MLQPHDLVLSIRKVISLMISKSAIAWGPKRNNWVTFSWSKRDQKRCQTRLKFLSLRAALAAHRLSITLAAVWSTMLSRPWVKRFISNGARLSKKMLNREAHSESSRVIRVSTLVFNSHRIRASRQPFSTQNRMMYTLLLSSLSLCSQRHLKLSQKANNLWHSNQAQKSPNPKKINKSHLKSQSIPVN